MRMRPVPAAAGWQHRGAGGADRRAGAVGDDPAGDATAGRALVVSGVLLREYRRVRKGRVQFAQRHVAVAGHVAH